MKKISELLKNISVLDIVGSTDVVISGISLNSNKIEEGALFVALVGNLVDGHSFIDNAIDNGAKVVVHEKVLSDLRDGVTYIKVSDTHEVCGILVNNLYDDPSRKLELIGVTGTNGKTTVTTLLHSLFRNLGYKVGMIGTVVNKINDESFESERTTPDPVSLGKLLAAMVREGCQYCFMEVSSHAVSERRISGLNFKGGVFTNLTLDHLDYHKTFENYRDAKKTFFDQLQDNAFAISNKDDANGEYILKDTKAHKYLYSLKNDADFTDRLESKLIGEFNAYNILAIYATAVALGEDKDKVKETIKLLEPVEGRFQYIKSENNITAIVDYAHTPDALENVLKTINLMKNNGKIISVFGCGGDRDKTKRSIMAKIGYDMSDVIIMTADNPRSEKVEDILSDMNKGVDSLPQDSKVYMISDRREAIACAYGLAKSGDYILLAGKGHEKYQEMDGKRVHFDDMEEIKKLML